MLNEKIKSWNTLVWWHLWKVKKKRQIKQDKQMQIDVICVYTCVFLGFFFNFLTNRSQAPLSYFQASWSKVNENTDKSVNTWFILPQASGKYLFDVGKHCENSSKTNGTSNITNNKILMGITPTISSLWKEEGNSERGKQNTN